MMSPPTIENEALRLASVHSLAVLDTPTEPEFDELVELAAWTCHAPMAALSLIDENRQWFKSTIALDLPETPRATAICAHTIVDSETLVVPDTTRDPRFEGNPFVINAPEVRFYAGVPITIDEGLRVGTLCVLDTRPRQLFSDERRALEIIARQAAAHLRADRLEWTAVDAMTGLATELAVNRWLICQRHDRTRAAIHLEILDPTEIDVSFRPTALRLRAAAPADATVARIGGNNVVVLLDSVDDTQLAECVDSLRFVLDELQDSGVEIALGLAVADAGHNGDDLIEAAARATALEGQLRRS